MGGRATNTMTIACGITRKDVCSEISMKMAVDGTVYARWLVPERVRYSNSMDITCGNRKRNSDADVAFSSVYTYTKAAPSIPLS